MKQLKLNYVFNAIKQAHAHIHTLCTRTQKAMPAQNNTKNKKSNHINSMKTIGFESVAVAATFLHNGQRIVMKMHLPNPFY